MSNYLRKRLLLVPITLVLISMIVFPMLRFIPGSAVDLIVARMSDNSGGTVDRAAIEHALGLDVSIYEQYARWVIGIAHGDLGTTLRGTPVTEEIFRRLPITIELSLLGILIGVSISLPVGLYSATRQDTWGDYVSRTFAVLAISVPSFFTGTLIMIYPSIWWGWSPPMVLIPFAQDPLGNLGMFILPAFIMGMVLAGASMRMTRTMMLEVLRQEYIRTAYSKGVSEGAVIFRHALKNALIPVITIIGHQLPLLVGGSVVIERIFVLPGIGRLLLDALAERDYPIVSGITLIMSAFVLIVNLLVDLTYGWLDPRIKFG